MGAGEQGLAGLTPADLAALDLKPQIPLPDIVGTRKGPLYIVAPARCVWDDMLAAGFQPGEGVSPGRS